ncbi:hypothetical protein SAMN04490244_10193 [Tranquillimonas rosea]|uniref:Uncharacterized protein n=1 Tax=Tranquillimonas rosea TaxID=641238 RepID=A0A1H9PAI2_9RHOB|nr:hypothetical protein [Tranquillimonas rosea]SER45131.1 hypothetical protein SAMN04490244_10193 [Tranquillimonas rosea]
MVANKLRNMAAATRSARREPTPDSVVLCVGELTTLRASGSAPREPDQFVFAEIHEVGDWMHAEMTPELVLSPLLTPRFDCVDLAHLLHHHGYRGRYRVLSDGLPNPGLVCGEIRAQCPGLDFDIVTLPANTRLS